MGISIGSMQTNYILGALEKDIRTGEYPSSQKNMLISIYNDLVYKMRKEYPQARKWAYIAKV